MRNEPTTEHRAAAARALRVLAGLTQTEMAERVGVSKPTYAAIEHGLRGDVEGGFRRVREALGVSSEEFEALARLASSAPLATALEPDSGHSLRKRLCQGCGRRFQPRSGNQRICGPACPGSGNGTRIPERSTP